jgi:multisubunit Na+/H+ antiporter MnhG subunit
MSTGIKLDVRVPIGVMFAIIGMIVALFGLVSDKDIYSRSLNVNINLWWGLVMLAFGSFMLIMARRSSHSTKKRTKIE